MPPTTHSLLPTLEFQHDVRPPMPASCLSPTMSREIPRSGPLLRAVPSPVYARSTGGLGTLAAQGGDAGRIRPESRSGQIMTSEAETSPSQGMDAVLLAHRAQLIRFLESHGAGDAAEDLFQELWMRVTQRATGPVGNPLAYLYRAANNLMVDRYRAERQSRVRDQAWIEVRGAAEDMTPDPGAEETLIAREQLARMDAALSALGDRASRCFRRFRLDGVSQREIAVELGVSLSTVESDLRRAYAALLVVRRQSDDA